MKRNFSWILGCLIGLFFLQPLVATERFVTTDPIGFAWIRKGEACPILVDKQEDKGVLRAVDNLQTDALKVTGIKPELTNAPTGKRILIIGSLDNSSWIKQLVQSGKINADDLQGKNEKYIICTVKQPLAGVDEAVVIAGSDKRGTIYGVYELSTQIGISPWYYWADVPVDQRDAIFIRAGTYTDGEPAVKYRGIFLNDEWPSLGNWATQTFGGFNSKFYEKLFELVLRLKGNFMWPAMWNSAFYDDDPLNGPLANEMGIVMGTSHHEPLGLAQQDWKRRGTGVWDYKKNGATLRDFWQKGMERCKDWEAVITVGMRGDGDEPMSESANISLLQNIVKDQRAIIAKATGKKASETPQVWALYKEVQEYYDKGMRVPDDVTLLLCDDNWGNVRKLPDLNARPRKGGYGMYYHFDYVGAPRNSKWINITQIQRTWEQMTLTYEYGVRQLWVVNVGDFKPMEYPITFFLDMAWNPHQFNENNLFQHVENFCKQQFGSKYAKEAARLMDTYTKYNRRVTPELLNDKTYSLENYNEWQQVRDDYSALALDALKLYYLMPENRRDAFDQLVLFPIQACSNLYDMYYALAMNRNLARNNDPKANQWAGKVRECFERDSVLTYHYNHIIRGGKWNHMMDQTHIGYTSWNDPKYNSMPEVSVIPETRMASAPYLFKEKEGYISIEAEHYTRSSNGTSAKWITIPNLGRTLSAVTTSPCTVTPDNGMYLEYDFEAEYCGETSVLVRFSSTLNFNNNRGLRYAVSLDGGEEQIVNINGDYRGDLGKWQAEHVIDTQTKHALEKNGKHTLRIRPLDPALVIQKIMIDFGGLKPSFLGAPETL
ncbi:glycosyl hydrolase 115 family protein [Bacteroides sp.]|uniref:glycosyl hydrolase 115 family protein n=1 Tax=Bacteroides sp. TaxID=29523 RepID=UPI00261A64D1|nr:glycosyl hydrolase 115 family protein [Bacteroides sp.]